MNQLAILCQTEEVDDATCTLIARACNAQTWHVSAQCDTKPWSVVYYQNPALVPPDAARLWILANPDVANALGYHDKDPHGHPYARVFWHPIRDNGGTLLNGPLSLSVTCSHELAELIGDPPATYWCQMPDGRLVALELADPVEGDAYEVRLTTGEKVSVSNFVTKNWFSAGSSGPYDHMGLCKGPFELRPEGYRIIMEAKKIYQEFADEDKYPEWKKELKTGQSRTARRMAPKGDGS
jgi:hypothetical protein